MRDELEKDFKSTKGDVAYSATNAVLSSIPILGSAVSEIFNLVLASPLEKRKESWMIRIAESIDEINREVESFSIENLINNDVFVSVLNRASQLAISNHQEEKLHALQNVIINTALNIDIEENEQMMFINLIDSLTPWHLKIIYYFEDPKLRFVEANKPIPNLWTGSPIDPLLEYYPELKEKKDFLTLIVKELFRQGIMSTDSLSTMMTESGIYVSRLTDYGRRFLSYITYNKKL